MDFSEPWSEHTFVAFDTETTGAYPLESEVCEFAAVKWQGGRIIGEYQTFLKPSKPMSDFIINIHHITNEMVADAPTMSEKAQEIRDFFGDAFGVAHHAPFDMGFMAAAFESDKVQLPSVPSLCTSLLSRNIMAEMPNHKLQTLVRELQLDGGQAHRALDDAKSCLSVFLKCMERAAHPTGQPLNLQTVFGKQGGALEWSRFSIGEFEKEPIGKAIIAAIRSRKSLEVVYMGGTQKGKPREIRPMGIVRNPDGDYVMAYDDQAPQLKRFYINRFKSAEVLLG
jgi:DNA polymerase-3 subunit epsilon